MSRKVIGVKYVETTITTDSAGRAYIGSEILTDSVNKILSVNVTHGRHSQ